MPLNLAPVQMWKSIAPLFSHKIHCALFLSIGDKYDLKTQCFLFTEEESDSAATCNADQQPAALGFGMSSIRKEVAAAVVKNK